MKSLAMKWFACGQRVREFETFETFEKALVLASGYIVDANGDITNAFWCLRLPSWEVAPDFMTRRFVMAQRMLIHTRTNGFSIALDFEVYR